MTKGHFTLRGFEVKGGWFGGSYLALMLVAPLVNAAVTAMNGSLKAWSLAALAMILTFAPHHLFTGVNLYGQVGHSFLTMLFVYLTARVFAEHFKSGMKISLNIVLLLAFPIGTLIATVYGSMVTMVHHQPVNLPGVIFSCSTYDAPQVWLFAIGIVFLFATRVKVPDALGKVCSYIAPFMFGVYLFHDATGGCYPYIIRFQRYLSLYINSTYAIIILAAIVLFTVGIIVDMIRHQMVRSVLSLISRSRK